jgi:hypothetical protein
MQNLDEPVYSAGLKLLFYPCVRSDVHHSRLPLRLGSGERSERERQVRNAGVNDERFLL